MKTIRWIAALFLLMNQVGSMVVAVNEVPWLGSNVSLVQEQENSSFIDTDSPLIQKRKDLPLAKKCEAVESIQALEKQERKLPEEYRFILLDDGYEVLQEQCNEKIEETLTFHGEVASAEIVPPLEELLSEQGEESTSDDLSDEILPEEQEPEEEISDTEEQAESPEENPLNQEKLPEPGTLDEETLDIESLALVVSSGAKITVDIPAYNETNGRNYGVVYDGILTVAFGDTTSTGKKIELTVPEGMRFDGYPVLGTPASGTPETAMDNVLAGFVDTVSKVSKKTYNSFNGTVTYAIKSNAETIEIPFKVAVDDRVYYGPKLFTGGVVAKAYVNNALVDQVSMSVNATKTVGFSARADAWRTLQAMSGSTAPVILPTAGVVRGWTTWYAKSIKVYYYFPKELKATAGGTINQSSGYVLATFGECFTAGQCGSTSVHLSAENTGVGTYTAPQAIKFELEMYDGTIITLNYNTAKVTVLDPASVANKATLAGMDGEYYPYSNDYYANAVRFGMRNEQPIELTNQYMEWVIPTGYLASQVIFPYNNTVNQVEYTTSVGPTIKIASGSQLITVNASKGIDRKILGLADGEYITWAKAFIGNFSGNYSNYSSINEPDKMRALGKLDTGVQTVNISVKTYALDGSGVIDPTTLTTQTNAVTRTATPTISLSRTIASYTAPAGKRTPMSATFATSFHNNSMGLVNPIVYFRLPPKVDIPIDSIKAKNNYGETLTIDIRGPYTSERSKENFIEAKITGKMGSFFDNKVYTITLSFDVLPSIEADGNYKWEEYMFIRDDVSLLGAAVGNQPAPIADTMDVNNDKNYTERLAPMNNDTNLRVTPNKILNIDTYILPNGGTRQPEYNPSNPSSAIGFTPSSRGDYTVELFNNRDDVVTKIETYLPVPRVGNNFGSEFQSTGFSRNMKLGNAPVIKVYNKVGADITTTASGNYQILYTTGATNGSNYQGATYTSSRVNATMIKVINTAGIQPGEKAVITFDYVVDEDTTSVTTNLEKIGSVNDFRPYYYFEAGSIGWQNGTRVGASLHIGEIRGVVFTDMDGDGVFSGADSPLANAPVSLYLFSGVNYQLKTTTTTTSTGAYIFSDLGNGNYKVDFTAVKATTQYFTKKGDNADLTKNSVVEYLGVNSGIVINIDPTTESSKRVNAGVVGGYTSGTLGVTLTGVTTLTITSTGTNPTANLIANITPTFFESIKATTDSVLRTSSNPGVVSVSSNGQLEGKQTGTGKITITIKDQYGNTAQTTKDIVVLNRIPLTCTTTYAPDTNTNQNVIATLTGCNKPITITNTSFTPCQGGANEVSGGLCTFTNTGSFTFTYIDSYGNTGATIATVNWIDKSPVTGSITYIPNTATSGNVQVSISFNKTGVTVTNNSMSTNYTFTSDGSFTFTYTDDYGNTGSTTATVDWIDKTPPTTTSVSYNPSGKTNKDVLVTLITSEQVQAITGRTGGPTVRNKTYNANVTGTVTFYDLVGNTGSTGININRVDKSAVTGTITYTPNTATSGNVQAEITFNKTGVTVIGGVPSLSGEVARSAGGVIATFTGNTSFTFTYQDDYGNTGATTATVNRIDKTPPVAINVSYAPSTNTNTDVGVTLTISEPVHRPTDRNGNTTGTVFTKTYTANATGTVTFYDLVGNSGSTGININRIDKSPVVGSVVYTPSTATSGDVQANITFNKPNVTITNANSAPCQGGTGEVIGGVCTFTGDGSFTFTYIDNYGNTGSTTAIVNRIDKIPPRVVDLQYSPRTTTRGTVEVTITLSESGTIITNGRIPTDCVGTFHQNVLSGETAAICWQKSFAINTNETVTFYDLVGNKSTAPVSITQIVTGGGGGGGGGKTGGEGGDSGTGDTPIGEESNDGNNTSDEEISHIDEKGSSTVENNENTHGTSEVSTPDNEIEFSYTRAYQYDITTQSSLEEANPNGVLIRAHLAKMIVNYLANALDRQPDFTKDCSAFGVSIQNETAEMQKYMKLACQYGIMGIHTDGTALSDFMPRKTVSRAEFGTVLSRILWGDTYNDSKPYYVKHLQALKNSGIMTQIDNPEKRLELRKWVWVMLMRSVEGEKPASQVDKASLIPTANEIATLSSIETSPSTGTLTRGYLAKMVVDYAVNTLGKTLPEKIPAGCYWKDASKAWESAEMKEYAIKACSLGLMGRDMEYFQPYTKITQEQLAIILYRLLYDATYVGKKEPRKMPLETLIADGVLEPVTNPKAYVVSEGVVASILSQS